MSEEFQRSLKVTEEIHISFMDHYKQEKQEEKEKTITRRTYNISCPIISL